MGGKLLLWQGHGREILIVGNFYKSWRLECVVEEEKERSRICSRSDSFIDR